MGGGHEGCTPASAGGGSLSHASTASTAASRRDGGCGVVCEGGREGRVG